MSEFLSLPCDYRVCSVRTALPPFANELEAWMPPETRCVRALCPKRGAMARVWLGQEGHLIPLGGQSFAFNTHIVYYILCQIKRIFLLYPQLHRRRHSRDMCEGALAARHNHSLHTSTCSTMVQGIVALLHRLRRHTQSGGGSVYRARARRLQWR
jgi:hypothetical protein